MSILNNYHPEDVSNLELLLNNQKKKIEMLRNQVKTLKFIPVDPAGAYTSITFKSFDGGMFNLHFDPFEFDIVDVADSNGNIKLKFAAPNGDLRGTDELRTVIADLEKNPIIRRFLDILNKDSLIEISEILTNKGTLMELGEFACIFDKIASAPEDERTIILKDGFLRTKKLKAELIAPLLDLIKSKKRHVKVIGVAKASKLMFLLKAAVICEKLFPDDMMGYVEIPLDIENMAYRWSGHGMLDSKKAVPLDYAFGSLYIAKLARHKNLFVTVEIPKDLKNNNLIYTNEEINEIMGHLVNDSIHSYPVIGYPQTIMKAHEFAVSLGLPASILRDTIMERLVNNTDASLSKYVRDAIFLGESVDKGSLGGRM